MSTAPAPRVAAAFVAADRRWFLPAAQRAHAAEDRPLAIGYGQTNSQPSTVAAMLALLDVPTGARVLDVGAGSGWTTALLAVLVGPGGEVLGLERHTGLAERGAASLAAWRSSVEAAGALPGAARIEAADPHVLGRRVPDGWDRILVSAAAEHLPAELVSQLAAGGRLVVPVRHAMSLVARTGKDVRVSEHGTYTFVPLVEG